MLIYNHLQRLVAELSLKKLVKKFILKMSSFYKKDQAKSQNDNRIYHLYSSHFHLNVDCQTPLTKEWSIKGKKKRTVFSDNSNGRISWFHSLSDRRTGSKVDQFDAAKAMQREKNDVEYVFSAAEYLTGQQIACILFTFKYERQVNGHSRFERGREWEV